MLYLRWGVHEILQRREGFEDPLWYQFKIAVPHIIHEVNVRNVQDNAQNRTTAHKNGC